MNEKQGRNVSEPPAVQRGSASRSKRRQRGPRKPTRIPKPVAPAAVAADPAPSAEGPAVAPVRTRRTRASATAPVVRLSRAQEMAYIRSDMNRLFVISGGLLALMLLVLLFSNR